MTIDILTLFPEMFPPILNASIIGRAQQADRIVIKFHNLRDWAIDTHKTVDDTPYGGGPGMVLKVDVVDRALTELKRANRESRIANKKKPHIILLTPQGKRLTQRIIEKLAQKEQLIMVAGHYEGFDERVRALVDQEISIGDYILTGGELPAMVLTDAIVRLIPGVLGKNDSLKEESHSLFADRRSLLEYPHYTRPESYLPISMARQRPLTVPTILKSGDHKKIALWRRDQAEKRTKTRRPDLLVN